MKSMQKLYEDVKARYDIKGQQINSVYQIERATLLTQLYELDKRYQKAIVVVQKEQGKEFGDLLEMAEQDWAIDREQFEAKMAEAKELLQQTKEE